MKGIWWQQAVPSLLHYKYELQNAQFIQRADGCLCTTLQGAVRVQANVSTAAESFQIPACPDLIPNGPWKKVEGGVCAAKGFKATGKFC